ncbi:MAG: nucleoid occlusion protein [Ruminococcaceae bacterium]|nr:nucleoid occlusion protein [Oscillospiraceae bacterium]
MLSALKTKNTYRNQIIEIPVELIKPNPYQPRHTFNKESLSELADSIKEYGVLQPISVRRISFNKYELVTGERRLKASIKANIKTIPAIVVNFNDNDSAIVSLIENVQRENLSFFEEARAFSNIINEHGLTQEELAQKLGKNQSTIANKLRLLKLSKFVISIIEENNLTERHARALLKLPDEYMQLKVLNKVCEEDLNVKETEKIVSKVLDDILEEAKKEREKSKKMALKDVRIFDNTIKKAVGVMQKNGVDAVFMHNEDDMFYEYVIRIPKNDKQKSNIFEAI